MSGLPESTVEERDVVILGGGIAGIEALMALADLGDNRLRLHLVADAEAFALPPQLLGAPWDGPVVQIPLEPLCRAFGARFTRGLAVSVRVGARELTLAEAAPVSYDHLLAAPGARRALAYTDVRTLGFGRLPDALADSSGSVALLVPAGASWTLPAYQLALLAAGAGRDVRVLTVEPEPLAVFGAATHAAAGAFLERHGVAVETGLALPGDLLLDALADTVIALPLAAGPAITGLPLDEHGFIRADADMAVAPGVHAAGDASGARVKHGGLAAQQADAAAAEIVRACGGTPPPLPYLPLRRGKLTARDGEALYLRRRLDGEDEGRTLADPLWQPASAISAPRLARWLDYHHNELDPYEVVPAR